VVNGTPQGPFWEDNSGSEAVTMKQIPFLAFPTGEQDAVFRALRDAGIPLRTVCVSRHDGLDVLAAAPSLAFTTVSTPHWCRTYDSRANADWIAALSQELGVVTA
jgi:hypothetical protein